MSLTRREPSILSPEGRPGATYLAHGAAADIWIVCPAQRPKLVCKVIRVNPERLRRNRPNNGPSSQSSNNLWEDFVKEYGARVAAWSSLSHANVVRVFGVSSELSLEVGYYENGCVRDYLKAHSSTVDKVAMISDVLAGMEYLHQHSPPIVHGNINAGKLFIDRHGKTAVGEFGLAGLCYPFAGYASSISFTGITRWFSPELLDDDADHVPQPTLASDVWALGSTLYEILAETLPYSNYKHEIKVQRAIIAGEPPGRRDGWLGAAHLEFLWPIIESCWAAAPENRPNVSRLTEDISARGPDIHPATLVGSSPDDPRATGPNNKTAQTGDLHTGVALFKLLQDHSDRVTSVAIFSGGRRLVSGSEDMTVRIWDIETGAALFKPLRGHSSWVNSIAVSSDDQHIVSGSDDLTVRIWNAETGAELFEPLRGHSGWVNSVAISSDGWRIVSGSEDMTVRIWDAHTGATLLEPLKGHSGAVKSVAISSEGRRIVSGSDDMTVRVWDAETGATLLKPLKGHSGFVRSVAISSDGQRIVSGSWDKTVRIWDAETGAALLKPLGGHWGFVKSVTISSDGRRIVSGSDDNLVRIWDAHTGTALFKPLQGHSRGVTSVAISSDGRRIASGSDDATVRIWDVQTDTVLFDPLLGHSNTTTPVAGPPDNQRIASDSGDKIVRVQDAQADTAPLEPLPGHPDQVSSMKTPPALGRVDMAVAEDTAHATRIMTKPTISSGLSQSFVGTSLQPSSLFNKSGGQSAGIVFETQSAGQAQSHISDLDDVKNSIYQIAAVMDCDMPILATITALGRHGFRDLTRELDPSSCLPNIVSLNAPYYGRLRDGTLVAIKIDAPGAENIPLAYMAYGLHAWSKCEHPNIARLLGLAKFKGQIATVSLFMENGDLPMFIQKYPTVDRFKLCVHVANGVTYLHSIGIIHGCLHGRNVLISRGGAVVIDGFGHAMSEHASTLIDSGSWIPKRWAAPELLEGNLPGSTEADVYALGMIILEAFTGEVPYPWETDIEVVRHVMEDDSRPARELEHIPDNDWGDALWDLLVQCWSHNPRERPTAAVIHDRLRAISAMRYPAP